MAGDHPMKTVKEHLKDSIRKCRKYNLQHRTEHGTAL